MENPLKSLGLVSQTKKDLVVILLLSILVFAVSIAFSLPATLLAFVRAYNSMELDDLIVLSIFLVLALAAFSYRRWQEVKGEIRERRGMEQALLSANRRLQLLNDITRHDIINSLTGLFLLLNRSEAKAAGNPGAGVPGHPELLAEIQKE